MIVGYLNIEGIPLMPSKTYPPLIVNSDAVLPLPIASQLLQTVTWRHTQVFQVFRSIQQQ
jgi:hypothetical protein